MVEIRRLAACALACTLLIAAAPASAATLSVPATSNIFGAGHGSPPPAGSCTEHSDALGIGPPGFAFAAGPGKVLTFSSVTGLTHWGENQTPTIPPDGEVGIPQSVASTAGISGIDDTVSRLTLNGVFLTDAEPADPAPARLSFGSHSFTTLSPQIEQGFFVGDGLTGTGSGSQQQFVVPATATRLYLGFMDGFDFTGPPGCYQKNSGTLSATFEISAGSQPPTPPAPPLPPPPPPPEPDPSVGTVVEIRATKKGKPNAQIFRNGSWAPLGEGDSVRPGDRIKTDGKTALAFELDLGGRVAARPNTEVEVVGERSVIGKSGDLRLRKGGVWAKCGQMKESLEIQTTGGVIGIKG